MPFPKRIARLNRLFTNRLMRPLAGRMPPLAIVVHRGRKSGTEYRTPVMAFPRGGSYVLALTYGADVDWLRNIVAAGGGELIYQGRTIRFGEPRRIDRSEALPDLPAPVRFILPLVKVDQFLHLSSASIVSRDPALPERRG